MHCRAGTTTLYSWGNDINSTHANYNWDGNQTSGNDPNQTVNVGQYVSNSWFFLMCMVMFGNGFMIGRQFIQVMPKPTLPDRFRAPTVLFGAGLGLIQARSCVQLCVISTHRASVLVSKSSELGTEG